MSTMAVGAIGLYRRHISPRKGFRCAHGVLHHRGSCSDFGLRVYERYSLGRATALMLRRFAACRAACQTLLAMAAEATPTDEKSNPPRRSDLACNALDVANCATLPVPDATCLACDCTGGLF